MLGSILILIVVVRKEGHILLLDLDPALTALDLMHEFLHGHGLRSSQTLASG